MNCRRLENGTEDLWRSSSDWRLSRLIQRTHESRLEAMNRNRIGVRAFLKQKSMWGFFDNFERPRIGWRQRRMRGGGLDKDKFCLSQS